MTVVCTVLFYHFATCFDTLISSAHWYYPHIDTIRTYYYHYGLTVNVTLIKFILQGLQIIPINDDQGNVGKGNEEGKDQDDENEEDCKKDDDEDGNDDEQGDYNMEEEVFLYPITLGEEII